MPASTLWVAPYHQRNPLAAIRLFCFPYAAGGASIFARWAKALSPEVEVCPVQLPGRENRMHEPYLTSVGDAADLAVEELAPYFDMKFAFFGHSLGALIAYELAQRLRRKAGAQPQHLIVSAHRAPQLPFPLAPTWNLPDADLKRRLEKLAGTPREVLQHEELLALMMPLIRADFRLDETYTHHGDDEPLDCPITVFGGRQDNEISEADLRAWSEVTRGGCELRMMDGDHFFIQSQADALVPEVGRILRNPR